VRNHNAQIIADEVMTGLGRASKQIFASHSDKVQPDYLCIAKGLSGGYLPMAATITTQKVFDAFLGDYSEFKTFFHGHSFTGNPLGAAASLASIELLESKKGQRIQLAKNIKEYSKKLWELETVGDMRQSGCVLGIELVRNWKTKEPFNLTEQAGIRVCAGLAKKGILTRPIGNVIVVMPPYCTTKAQIKKIFSTLHEIIDEIL
jgi:adenosylmethionine-8-amino-7-oxononanoate aminotransferase